MPVVSANVINAANIDNVEYTLRSVSEHDHDWLVELHNDDLVLNNITDPKPITLLNHLRWWESIQHSKTEERLIFCKNGYHIGFTKFYKIDLCNRNCVLGADIHSVHRGNGYAKIMWSLMLDHCFEKLDLYRVSLTTAEYNKIGQRVYTNLGFKEEGRLVQSLYRDGKYHDQICMYMLKQMWPLSSQPIV